TVVQSAPDWDTKARDPGRALAWAKLAFSPMPGTRSPRQLGPRMRIPDAAAAAPRDAARVGPPPAGARPSPAVNTTAARVPRAPSSATTCGTTAGGVQTTASSGTTGRSWTRG